MVCSRLMTLLLAGACVAGAARGAAAQAVAGPGVEAPAVEACAAAGVAAERAHGIPAGLLLAIGRVESGRRDPVSGRMAAWPWTINAEGSGHLYDSQAQALAATRALQQAGVASIDVGCFQVNLVHHRAAFATLEEGFDPQRNADYAARFLGALQAKTGSWEAAVGAYHSAVPERGNPYRDRVMAGWARGGGDVAAAGPASASGLAGPVPAAPMRAGPVPLVVRMVSWTPPAPGGVQAMRVWTPSGVGLGAAVIRMGQGGR